MIGRHSAPSTAVVYWSLLTRSVLCAYELPFFLFMIVPYKIIYHSIYNKCHLVKRWRVFSFTNQPAKENCATFSLGFFSDMPSKIDP